MVPEPAATTGSADRTAAVMARVCDLALFGAAFVAVFAVEYDDPLEQLGKIERAVLPRAGAPALQEQRVVFEDMPVPAAWSDEELLREKDFAAYTDAERAAARALLARLARRGPRRLSRRTRGTRRRREEHDLRATVRVSLRHGGELLERRYREPAERPRRLVLVCGVSGPMAPYAPILLQYLQPTLSA